MLSDFINYIWSNTNIKAIFANKVICITGASSGIGQALARQLAEQPCTLILASRSLDKLMKLKEELESDEVDVKVISVDLENEKSIEEAFLNLKKEVDVIDLLINNAGISQRGLALETDFKVVQQIMAINFLGTIQWTTLCMSLVKKAYAPQIIVISSVVGEFGFPLRSAYSASKHALKGYFESMQLETASPVVTIVSPGRVQTNISMNAVDGRGVQHGVMDPGQASGISVEKAARIILKGAARKKKNIYIGRGEVILLFISRYCPPLFRKIAKSTNAK